MEETSNMYADLPESIKEIVKEHLLADEFHIAKRIHDDWVRRNKLKQSSDNQSTFSTEHDHQVC